MRRTLILTLSANRSPWWQLMAKQRETWDSIRHDQTSTIYYVGDSYPARFDPPVLHSPTDEHLHNIGHRTVEALEFALTIPDWHFLARPHSSTYVHKRHLVEFVETAQPELLYGLVVPAGPHEGPWLWGGGHFVMSRAVVQKLVANKTQWDHGIMEDVAMSRLAASLGIPFGNGKSVSVDWKTDLKSASCISWNGDTGGFDFSDFKDLNRLEDQFFFRVKHDPDRSVDLRTMDLLFQNLIP